MSASDPGGRPAGGRVASALVWSLVVGALLLSPASRLPDPGAWDWLDKPLHALLFAVHWLLVARALPTAGSPARGLAAATVISGLYATLLELAQPGIAGRSWSAWDLVAGWLGIALAALFLGRRRATLGRSS